MDKQHKEKLVIKYFIPTPPKPGYAGNWITIILGVILLLAGLSLVRGPVMFGAALPGLIISIVGIAALSNKRGIYIHAYNKAEPKATDEQMDQWLEEGKDLILQEALSRLDIETGDASRDPLIIDGPAGKTQIKAGKDNIYRFRHHNILLFYLTEHNVATFNCILDIGIGEILESKTKEFPYKDITNLETETTSDTFYYVNNIKANEKGIQTFSLYTSGGNHISVNYFFSKDISGNNYRYPPSNAEDTIKAIRKRLKEYKDKYSRSIE